MAAFLFSEEMNTLTQIITVKEARKLLGKESETYTDKEIRLLIRDYETLARLAIREYLVLKKPKL